MYNIRADLAYSIRIIRACNLTTTAELGERVMVPDIEDSVLASLASAKVQNARPTLAQLGLGPQIGRP